jgi:hypothetical protein
MMWVVVGAVGGVVVLLLVVALFVVFLAGDAPNPAAEAAWEDWTRGQDRKQAPSGLHRVCAYHIDRDHPSVFIDVESLEEASALCDGASTAELNVDFAHVYDDQGKTVHSSGY